MEDVIWQRDRIRETHNNEHFIDVALTNKTATSDDYDELNVDRRCKLTSFSDTKNLSNISKTHSKESCLNVLHSCLHSFMPSSNKIESTKDSDSKLADDRIQTDQRKS